jgi:hypothetical protein
MNKGIGLLYLSNRPKFNSICSFSFSHDIGGRPRDLVLLASFFGRHWFFFL